MASEGRDFIAVLKAQADPEDLPALLKACAGRRTYVPHTTQDGLLSDKNWIVRTIGREKAKLLIDKLHAADVYGGEIEIPFDGLGIHQAELRRRDMLFEAGVAEGKNNQQIANLCGITRRAVVMRKRRIRLREEKQRAKRPHRPEE